MTLARFAALPTRPAFKDPSLHMNDLITSDGIVPNLRAGSKKQVLQELARKAAEMTGLHERAIFDVVVERERLGTTGVGRGIAIPHGKLPGVKGVVAIFARLEKPVDFEAIDEQPVDLMCLLLAPEAAGADHLKALARVSRLLRDPILCDKLRGAETADAIYALLSQQERSHAA